MHSALYQFLSCIFCFIYVEVDWLDISVNGWLLRIGLRFTILNCMHSVNAHTNITQSLRMSMGRFSCVCVVLCLHNAFIEIRRNVESVHLTFSVGERFRFWIHLANYYKLWFWLFFVLIWNVFHFNITFIFWIIEHFISKQFI